MSRLLKNSGELLPRIQSLLVDSCPLEKQDEIKEVCEKYKHLFQAMEGVFHLMRKPNRLVKDGDAEDLDRSIKLTLETWRALNLNITVKAHLLETHVLSQFQKFGGLGDFIEEFLEQRHQYTKKRKRAMGGVADPQKRYDGIAKLNRLHNLSSVKEAQNSVLQASKRPFKKPRGGAYSSVSEERKNKKREEDDVQRHQTREELTRNPSLGKQLLTNHQRNKADAAKAYGGGNSS